MKKVWPGGRGFVLDPLLGFDFCYYATWISQSMQFCQYCQGLFPSIKKGAFDPMIPNLWVLIFVYCAIWIRPLCSFQTMASRRFPVRLAPMGVHFSQNFSILPKKYTLEIREIWVFIFILSSSTLYGLFYRYKPSRSSRSTATINTRTNILQVFTTSETGDPKEIARGSLSSTNFAHNLLPIDLHGLLLAVSPAAHPEFPRREGGPNPSDGGRNLLFIFPNFSQKLHENERNRTQRGNESLAPPPLDPSLVTHGVTTITDVL